MGEVDLFVGVTSIGADPEWLDRGTERRFATYWHTYGFGQLSYALLEHGLLNELRLWVHPLFVGQATPADLLFRPSHAARTATSPIRARSSSLTTGDGDSSTSFWCRRWTLHSRSPRWTTLPC